MANTGDNATLILPRLWLGNKKAAADTAFLRSNNISVVFNCTKELPFDSSVLRRYRVPVDDNLQPAEIDNMLNWSSEIVYKLIAEYKRGNTVLVHCHAGMQRSAAVVAMMMVAVYKQSVDDVVGYIRSKRPIAFFPAINFDRAIRGFEANFHQALGSAK